MFEIEENYKRARARSSEAAASISEGRALKKDLPSQTRGIRDSRGRTYA